MKFQRGNKLAKGGKRAGAGRKPSLRPNLIEALEGLDEKIPDVLDKLYDMAMGGHEKAAEYIIDRRIGRPMQGINITDEQKALDRIERLTALYVLPSKEIAEVRAKELPPAEEEQELLRRAAQIGTPNASQSQNTELSSGSESVSGNPD
jgi:hypothetical protein